tara:strand:- start:557 stop:970 length:414 start_codon:yes stop_codon:yes gene_type:complete
MPKQRLTIRDWSGGINNRQDPRDIKPNECSFIQNMSIDALGKIKTAGGLFDNLADSDGDTSSTPLTEYIVNRTAEINGSGGYGLFYFESDHSRDSEQTITETKSGTALAIGTSVGNITFVLVQTISDLPTHEEASGN